MKERRNGIIIILYKVIWKNNNITQSKLLVGGCNMWFNPLTSWVVSLFTTGIPLMKEKIGHSLEKPIPAENWANKELYYQDMMNGVSAKERMKNLEKGKYKLVEPPHLEPHRGADGRIVIENSLLYKEDLKKYGTVQTYKWVEQGKYNLTPEELEKENERIRKEMEYLFNL